MDYRTFVLGGLLLAVIVAMLVLAVRMLRQQRRAEEESVIVGNRIAESLPTPEPVPDLLQPLTAEMPVAGAPPEPEAADASPEPAASPLEPLAPAPPLESAPDGAPAEYALRAPVELWFSESVVGVKAGSPTYASYRKYADALLGDLKAARRAAR